MSNSIYYNHEFEAIKYRHEDQSKLLQFLTQIDLQLFSGFVTIELIFGGFIVQQNISSFWIKTGLGLINLSFSIVCSGLLARNYKRRSEVAGTLIKCNEALGFSVKDAYIPNMTINVDKPTGSWLPLYITGVVTSFLGILILLLYSGSSGEKNKESEIEMRTYNQVINTYPNPQSNNNTTLDKPNKHSDKNCTISKRKFLY